MPQWTLRVNIQRHRPFGDHVWVPVTQPNVDGLCCPLAVLPALAPVQAPMRALTLPQALALPGALAQTLMTGGLGYLKDKGRATAPVRYRNGPLAMLHVSPSLYGSSMRI